MAGALWQMMARRSGNDGGRSGRMTGRSGNDDRPLWPMMGTFIRRWVPELRNVPTKYIHRPQTMPREVQAASRCIIGADYPSPVVDEQESARQAKSRLHAVRQKTGTEQEARKVYIKHGSRSRQGDWAKRPAAAMEGAGGGPDRNDVGESQAPTSEEGPPTNTAKRKRAATGGQPQTTLITQLFPRGAAGSAATGGSATWTKVALSTAEPSGGAAAANGISRTTGSIVSSSAKSLMAFLAKSRTQMQGAAGDGGDHLMKGSCGAEGGTRQGIGGIAEAGAEGSPGLEGGLGSIVMKVGLVQLSVAQTGRATCRLCGEGIEEGVLRTGVEMKLSGGQLSHAWQHPGCFCKAAAFMRCASSRGKCKAYGTGLKKGEVVFTVRFGQRETDMQRYGAAAATAMLPAVLAAAGMSLQEVPGIEVLSSAEAEGLSCFEPSTVALGVQNEWALQEEEGNCRQGKPEVECEGGALGNEGKSADKAHMAFTCGDGRPVAGSESECIEVDGWDEPAAPLTAHVWDDCRRLDANVRMGAFESKASCKLQGENWACGHCTFLNDSLVGSACAMCERSGYSLPPPMK
ncbi:hypothetical protein CYMTET_36134 [Cymbomonas tetramitiformis]|uniref:PARP-type domain-containing protein n=1 Tax=Cymbomonas tetramitiformis TaxID=36881 RepID=A0AAE0CHZ0_9CHLO|nr:hypothetical protein CYMTET_36134 [Cymbomonas tetramitiformis]